MDEWIFGWLLGCLLIFLVVRSPVRLQTKTLHYLNRIFQLRPNLKQQSLSSYYGVFKLIHVESYVKKDLHVCFKNALSESSILNSAKPPSDKEIGTFLMPFLPWKRASEFSYQ